MIRFWLIALVALVGCGDDQQNAALDGSDGNADSGRGTDARFEIDVPTDVSTDRSVVDATEDATTISEEDANLAFCVTETNRLRAQVGRGPVNRSSGLEAFATEGAEVDTLARDPHRHFSSTGGGGIAFAENECPSFSGWRIMGNVRQTIEACLAAFFSEGPGGGHYENLIGNYGSVGCGYYLSGQGITIVQDFGR